MSLATRVIPCLDVDGGRVVKGVNFENLRDAGDPVELAAAYDAEGADELTFLDVTASSSGRSTMLEVVRRTAEQVFIPLTVGGGVRSVEDVDTLLRAGADKVSVNTAAIARPELLSELSRQFAPVGHKPDLRTIPLKDSITTVMFNAREGAWGSAARHALPQEKGAAEHDITGFLGFYWEERGKSFVWDDPKYDNWTEEEGATINHPGNDAQPFLYPAYRIITQKLPGIAAREYPG